MKRDWSLRPNLNECLLEDRIVPASMNNLGMIVLTTSGLTLATPFPGAVNMTAMGGGSSGSQAASVSGAAMPTSFYMTGGRGISTFMAGNFTGNGNFAGGGLGTASGVSVKMGSGAAENGGAAPTPKPMPPINGGQGPASTPLLAHIGAPSTGSGMPILAAGQSYQTPIAPVPQLPRLGTAIPGSSVATSPGATTVKPNSMGPEAGAPRFGPARASMPSDNLPGGLGVGGGLLPIRSSSGY